MEWILLGVFVFIVLPLVIAKTFFGMNEDEHSKEDNWRGQ